MSINHDLSKSSEHYTNQVHGISFNYKRNENKKLSHSEFYQNDEQSYDLEFEEKTEMRGKFKNGNNFKPSTKQTVDQNKYKKLKQKYFEEIEEKSEEEQQNEEKEISKEKEKKSKKNRDISKKNKKNKKNDNADTPPSKIMQNIYTVKNKQNTKIILDDEDEDENEEEEINNNNNNINNNNNNKKESEEEKEKDEELDIDNNSNDSEKEQKVKMPKKKLNVKNKKNKNKNKKKETSEEDEENSENNNNYKNTKKSKGENMNFRKKKTKTKKWNEEEYQSLLSQSKDYIPFKDYDINKFILTLSQMNNIKNNPELYNKYNNFLSLKKKQDKIQFETLLKNILINFYNICKNHPKLTPTFTVNSLFKNLDISNFDFKSSEKTAYFDLFISFISMYISDYESFIESTSIKDTNKLIIPLHALAFIFSSQIFFCDIARLIQNYYDKFLSYKIIPIYTKFNEEFIHRINSRHIIWKQFEAPFLFFKNKKKLYLKAENGESKIDEKKIEEFADKISVNINNAYNAFVDDIVKRHSSINKFNINDKRINLINNDTSVPSSLYNQINGDVTFKLKMNLYKYKMKQMKIRKLCKLNDAKIKKSEFEKKVKNTIFKKAAFYMSSCDVVQDFLDNYN